MLSPIEMNDVSSSARFLSTVVIFRKISSNFDPFFLLNVFYRSEKSRTMRISIEFQMNWKRTFSMRTFFILPSFFNKFRFSSKKMKNNLIKNVRFSLLEFEPFSSCWSSDDFTLASAVNLSFFLIKRRACFLSVSVRSVVAFTSPLGRCWKKEKRFCFSCDGKKNEREFLRAPITLHRSLYSEWLLRPESLERCSPRWPRAQAENEKFSTNIEFCFWFYRSRRETEIWQSVKIDK